MTVLSTLCNIENIVYHHLAYDRPLRHFMPLSEVALLTLIMA